MLVKLAPPRTRGARQRRARAREREGLACFNVVTHRDRLIAALIQSGRLTEASALDRAAVEAALNDMVAGFVARWLDKKPDA